MILKQKFSVMFEYNVVYTSNLFSIKNTALKKIFNQAQNPRVMIFVDENVASSFPLLQSDIMDWATHHQQVMEVVTPIGIIPGGEKIKNGLHHVEAMIASMAEANLCRHSYVMVIGGGAVLDAAGFAASIFHRGIRQIRVPTTVLSQDDSAVGVKNGVNYNGLKNLYGSFFPPEAVIIDDRFLSTLNLRDIRSGVAEAYKVAVIKDAELYDYIRTNTQAIKDCNPEIISQLVQRSSKLHLDHIRTGGDPFERGSSRPLDFGHWSAHKLEVMTGNDLRHGEAVAIGMAMDLYCAALLGMLNMNLAEEMLFTLADCGLALWHPAIDSRNNAGELEILEGLRDFQEHLGGELTLAMPVEIGRCLDCHDLPAEIVEKAVTLMKKNFQP
ncbi:MAG: 3-dehydroquinate synthase [Desulfobacteraceae bacterium]|nr:3-dehydroquinate synthase [Desulfobacteraceae bacterium]